jgi:porphobilinogen deaminase
MLEGLVASLDGQQVIRDVAQGRSSEAAGLGEQLGEILLRRGGDAILREIYGTA